MSKDLTDINNLPFVLDRGNQSELIPADVEHRVSSHIGKDMLTERWNGLRASLREATLRSYGHSQELKGLRQVVYRVDRR